MVKDHAMLYLFFVYLYQGRLRHVWTQNSIIQKYSLESSVVYSRLQKFSKGLISYPNHPGLFIVINSAANSCRLQVGSFVNCK